MLAIFAEGTTTNGSCLLPFKRGAFEGMRPVVPCYVSYDCGPVRPIFDSIHIVPLSILIFASLQWNTVTLNIMPEFRPNKVMLKDFKTRTNQNRPGWPARPEKTQGDWLIYASCVREAISKHSGLPLEDRNRLSDKLAFTGLVQNKLDQAAIDDRCYRAD